eukprot:2138102-Rhodomonas_salina.1
MVAEPLDEGFAHLQQPGHPSPCHVPGVVEIDWGCNLARIVRALALFIRVLVLYSEGHLGGVQDILLAVASDGVEERLLAAQKPIRESCAPRSRRSKPQRATKHDAPRLTSVRVDAVVKQHLARPDPAIQRRQTSAAFHRQRGAEGAQTPPHAPLLGRQAA